MEFELAYFEAVVQYFSHDTTGAFPFYLSSINSNLIHFFSFRISLKFVFIDFHQTVNDLHVKHIILLTI